VSKIPDSVRYSEKKYLAKYDLYVDLFSRFNLKAFDVVPLRNVFLISTDKGRKILKKINYSQEDVNFIYLATSYIKQNFEGIMDFVKTKDRNIYTLWKGDMYCMLDLIEGRECEFGNPIDIKIAASALGQLHNAGEGFKYDSKEKNILGRTQDSFIRKLDEINFFKSLANLHEIKSDFDAIFLENVEYYIKEIEKSLKALGSSSYLKLCSEEDKITICHHDLAHHNILINDEKAYFVDFDYAVIDLKVHDLSNFINKAIKNYAFDIERSNSILKNYCTYNTIDKREKEVLYAMLRFPEDFYSISKDYYARRKDWEEEVFVDRLIKKLDFKEDREEFLDNFLNTDF
jgi:CotS family spore coat protein